MDGLDIDFILKEYPEFLRANDLVHLGLFGSKFAVTNAVRQGNAPPRIKLGFNKAFFPKNLLVQWIKERNNTYM